MQTDPVSDRTQNDNKHMHQSVFLRLLKEGLPYWKIALIAVLAMIVTAALEPALPALMAPLIDESMIAKDPNSLIKIPILIVIVYIARGLFEFAATLSSQYVANRTVADLRSRVFAAQLDIPIEGHEKEHGGTFLSQIVYDCAQIKDAFSSAWIVIVKDSLVIMGLLIFLIYTSWQMSLTLLIAAPLVALIVRIANTKMRRSNHELQKWNGRLTGLIEESLAAIKDIKIFAGHKDRQTHFDRINNSLFREQMRVVKVQSLATPLIQILTAIVVGSVILVGTQMSANDQLSPGEFVAYITALGLIFTPLKRLTGITAVIQRGLAAADSIYAVLDQPHDNQKLLSKPEERLGTASISLEHIRFTYPGSETEALREITFQVYSGETVALVGPSGSGKTSVLAMIAGFIQPSVGTIRINDEDVSTWSLTKRRRQLSLVSQQINLFDGTIAENIAFGWPDASEEQIYEAARKANALDFINASPEGLATKIGPFGRRLSGGQRQRIAIARAFIKDAPILLLDEPTSALDHQSRDQVLRGLENLKANRTTLIISHQPETLLSINRTLYLVDGHLSSESSAAALADVPSGLSRF